MKREFRLNDWSSCRNVRSTRNLIYLCQIFVIWRENQTSEIKVFKIFLATIMNSSMDEVKKKEIAFLPGNFYNVRFSENYCFAVHKGDAESLSCNVSLWSSGQGVAWTCRSTGFDSRRRCFLFLCIVFGLFFLTLFFFLFFFFILTADPAGNELGSIYILRSSPEFYFGKGISKALDLHTGQAYDQIKTISSQDMSLLWNSRILVQFVVYCVFVPHDVN